MRQTALTIHVLVAVWLTATPPTLNAEKLVQTSASGDSTAVARGRELYMAVGCYACHGTAGQGAPSTGPKLAPDTLPVQALIAIVRNPPGEMPLTQTRCSQTRR